MIASKSSIIRLAAVTAMTLAASAAQATITVYTTQASYLAAISAPGVDNFNDLVIGGLNTPIMRSAGAYSYTASVGPNSIFYPAGDGSDHYLSTDSRTDTISFSNFSSTVRGVGGFFFGSDVNGHYLAGGTMKLLATDGSGGVSQQILNSTTASFLGFVSDGQITSLALSTGSPSSHWVTANDLTLGVAAVPEPGTYAMLLAGLGMLGLLARRRRG